MQVSDASGLTAWNASDNAEHGQSGTQPAMIGVVIVLFAFVRVLINTFFVTQRAVSQTVPYSKRGTGAGGLAIWI